jgi:hypothetical protein
MLGLCTGHRAVITRTTGGAEVGGSHVGCPWSGWHQWRQCMPCAMALRYTPCRVLAWPLV